MKNKIVLIMLLALTAALLVPASFAQMTATVRGNVKGEDGKPMVGVKVQYYSPETGRKYVLPTDKSGNYYSIGVASGNYHVSLLDADGKPLYDKFYLGTNVSMGSEAVLDINMQAERAKHSAGQSEEEKKKLAAAEAESKKIGGLNDRLKLSKQQQDQGQFEEAVKTLEEAVALDATRDLIWFKLGDAYLMAGKKNADRTAAKEEFNKAVEAYKKSIAIKPTVGAYYNNMGEAYARLGQTNDAVKAYSDAAANEPASAGQYYFNLGAVLTNSGKTDEANAAFEKAIAADPNRAEAYYQRSINLMAKATVDSKTGETHFPPEVAAGLQKYLEMAPTGPNAASAKDLLASMGQKVTTSFGPQKGAKKK